MAKQAENQADEVDADVLTAEINRLVYSAKLRIEQQRIHIQELSGSIAQRTRGIFGYGSAHRNVDSGTKGAGRQSTSGSPRGTRLPPQQPHRHRVDT